MCTVDIFYYVYISGGSPFFEALCGMKVVPSEAQRQKNVQTSNHVAKYLKR